MMDIIAEYMAEVDKWNIWMWMQNKNCKQLLHRARELKIPGREKARRAGIRGLRSLLYKYEDLRWRDYDKLRSKQYLDNQRWCVYGVGRKLRIKNINKKSTEELKARILQKVKKDDKILSWSKDMLGIFCKAFNIPKPHDAYIATVREFHDSLKKENSSSR